jgi:hypothetical protein
VVAGRAVHGHGGAPLAALGGVVDHQDRVAQASQQLEVVPEILICEYYRDMIKFKQINEYFKCISLHIMCVCNIYIFGIAIVTRCDDDKGCVLGTQHLLPPVHNTAEFNKLS